MEVPGTRVRKMERPWFGSGNNHSIRFYQEVMGIKEEEYAGTFVKGVVCFGYRESAFIVG
jgi:hypothetical protein